MTPYKHLERIKNLNENQLRDYCYNRGLTKENLIMHLEDDEDIKVDKNLTYSEIIHQYTEDIKAMLEELIWSV